MKRFQLLVGISVLVLVGVYSWTHRAKMSVRAINEADKVGNSPVGTSASILQKTFTVSKAADVSFEVPAHAANAQLHGTFHAFPPAGAASEDANIGFSLMTQEQYTDLLNQGPADAMFAAQGSHEEEVNVSLPPTIDKPATYHLVFKNESRDEPKVAVQADFRVDY